MLERVRKLEAARTAPRNPFEQTYGSFGAFDDQTLVLIDKGKRELHDMRAVLTALRRWHADRVWAGCRYTGDGSTEHGG